MDRDLAEFVNSCLHCMISDPSVFVPRPFGHALHADKPNGIIHFDFCYIGGSHSDFKYVLVVKDDFSSYTLLFPFENADSESFAEALTEWFSLFGVVSTWVSDKGTHFKNRVVSELQRKLHSNHHFTLPYSAWTNGTVEVVSRELLRSLRALTSEFQLTFRFWPEVLPIVQSVLNSTPVRRLGDKCPLTVFTGLPQDSPLTSVVYKKGEELKTRSLEKVKAQQCIKSERLLKALEDIHRDTAEKISEFRRKAVQAHNEKTHIRPCNFTLGSFFTCRISAEHWAKAAVQMERSIPRDPIDIRFRL